MGKHQSRKKWADRVTQTRARQAKGHLGIVFGCVARTVSRALPSDDHGRTSHLQVAPLKDRTLGHDRGMVERAKRFLQHIPPPQGQPVVASHPRSLASMSCRNLRRWPELDHFVFKVLPCSAPGANEPDTIVRSRIRQCSVRLLAPAVWQIQLATDPPAGSFLPLFNTWRFPNTYPSPAPMNRRGERRLSLKRARVERA